MIRIVLSKIVQREIPFCWSDWIIFYWSSILDLSRLMYLFLFYPILDYSFSYEHFNTTSSIGQPRKPISNGLHQEYSSSFWLWLYTGKTRNHCFVLLWGGTHQFTFICQNVAGFFCCCCCLTSWKMVMRRAQASITAGLTFLQDCGGSTCFSVAWFYCYWFICWCL